MEAGRWKLDGLDAEAWHGRRTLEAGRLNGQKWDAPTISEAGAPDAWSIWRGAIVEAFSRAHGLAARK